MRRRPDDLHGYTEYPAQTSLRSTDEIMWFSGENATAPAGW
ncbi:hypothetical protein GFS60_04259 [Rhodococcus sp. WAY2]|nr:hypothetical protein GFS60_04259 [Rhodococcus sp. WAY2]